MTQNNGTPADPAGVVPEEPGVYLDASGGYWVHHWHYRWELVAQLNVSHAFQVLRVDNQGNISAGDLVALDATLSPIGRISHIFPLTYLGDILDNRKESENA